MPPIPHAYREVGVAYGVGRTEILAPEAEELKLEEFINQKRIKNENRPLCFRFTPGQARWFGGLRSACEDRKSVV